MRLRKTAIAAIGYAWCTIAAALIGSAAAQDCALKPVKARGGSSVLEATAKSRARSVWIKKVNGDRKLGKTYAAWLRAKSPQYACRRVARRFVCVASAVPCKF